MKKANFCFLEEIGYDDCLALQNRLNRKRFENKIDDTILFLYHPDTISIGLRGEDSDILVSNDFCKQKNIHISKSPRGGQTTFHGFGQIVIYYIVDIRNFSNKIKLFVSNLKDIGIKTFSKYGVSVSPLDDELEGLWYQDSKISFIGISVKNKILMHGMSFNINIDSKNFSYIVSCGKKDRKHISLKEILNREIDIYEFCNTYKQIFCQTMGYENKDFKDISLLYPSI